MHRTTLLLALVLLAPTAVADDDTGRANAAALVQLNKTQEPGGTWKGGPTTTALAALAFFGAGNSHRHGTYKNTIKKFLRNGMKRQKANGRFGDDALHEHAITAFAFSEGYGMTKSPLLKGSVHKAIEYLVSQAKGDWSKFEPEGRAPRHTALWVAAALRSARAYSIRVDGIAASIAKGQAYANAELAAGGAHPTLAMTLYFVDGDIKKDTRLTELVARLSKPGAEADMSGLEHWCATMLMRQRGADAWQAWKPRVKALTTSQVAGVWRSDDGDAAATTALTGLRAMTLQVYGRVPK